MQEGLATTGKQLDWIHSLSGGVALMSYSFCMWSFLFLRFLHSPSYACCRFVSEASQMPLMTCFFTEINISSVTAQNQNKPEGFYGLLTYLYLPGSPLLQGAVPPTPPTTADRSQQHHQ